MVDEESMKDRRLRKLNAGVAKWNGPSCWMATLAQLVVLLCGIAYPDKAELLRSHIANAGLDVALLADQFTGIENFVGSTQLKDGSFTHACARSESSITDAADLAARVRRGLYDLYSYYVQGLVL